MLSKAPGVLASYEGLLLYVDTLCALGKVEEVAGILRGTAGEVVQLESDRAWLWGVVDCLMVWWCCVLLLLVLLLVVVVV